MRVALFVPCYIDQFYPQVAVATLELLEKLGCEVIVPKDQTCCGQPMANSGFASATEGCDANFPKILKVLITSWGRRVLACYTLKNITPRRKSGHRSMRFVNF